jgi:hypothetical protein
MCLTILPLTAYAIPNDGNASSACDFGQFLSKLGKRESNNNYAAKNSLGYLGRWQFGKGALADIGWKRNGVWTGNSQNFSINSEQDFLNNSAAQDQAMKEWMDLLAQRAKSFGVPKHIGKTIKGCKVTWSSIIAGRHLCGYGNRTDTSGKCHKGTSLIQFLESNGAKDGKDGYGTPVSEYVCMFSGLNMPYDHDAKATDCSSVNDAGETGNTETPVTYPGTSGGSHDGPNVETSPLSRFYYLSLHLKYTWVAAFQKMTAQLTTLMMQQVQIVGTFFDAKHQLETQRLIQEKTAQAHKDYQPSEQMCEIGTFVRNLTNTEKRADLTKTALTRAMLDRALATGDSKTSKDGIDQATKKRALIDTFCNKVDNAKQNQKLCDGTYNPEQINADINFTRSIDIPLTLDINLLDDEVTPAEENIFAFLDYIFMHERFPWMSKNKTVLFGFIGPYQDMRSIIAMRSVAQNSFAEIIAQKTAGPDGEGESVGPFMKALMRELGIEDEDIEATIGENPSYYAQMEMLTKTIYQHPEFISNLYDKPANVKRIRAALTAIKLMQDRDIHDALLRREMLMSMLLELRLREDQNNLLETVVKPMIKEKSGEADPAVNITIETSGSSSTF